MSLNSPRACRRQLRHRKVLSEGHLEGCGVSALLPAVGGWAGIGSLPGPLPRRTFNHQQRPENPPIQDIKNKTPPTASAKTGIRTKSVWRLIVGAANSMRNMPSAHLGHDPVEVTTYLTLVFLFAGVGVRMGGQLFEKDTEIALRSAFTMRRPTGSRRMSVRAISKKACGSGFVGLHPSDVGTLILINAVWPGKF
jgi:hypothetical protein